MVPVGTLAKVGMTIIGLVLDDDTVLEDFELVAVVAVELGLELLTTTLLDDALDTADTDKAVDVELRLELAVVDTLEALAGLELILLETALLADLELELIELIELRELALEPRLEAAVWALALTESSLSIFIRLLMALFCLISGVTRFSGVVPSWDTANKTTSKKGGRR